MKKILNGKVSFGLYHSLTSRGFCKRIITGKPNRSLAFNLEYASKKVKMGDVAVLPLEDGIKNNEWMKCRKGWLRIGDLVRY